MSRLLPVLLAADPDFTASRYMPDVQVHVAFNAGYATPAADREWTDVSQWVELEESIKITHGRQDEFSTAGANKLSLTLDNSDGRFTVGRTGSPYYPNVKLGRPIRVTATTVTGHTSVRFLGFVDEWPTEWDGTDSYAFANLVATSRMAWLSGTLPNVMAAEILADDPAGYWPLGDPANSTEAKDASGNPQSRPLTVTGSDTAIVFGNATGPGTDGITAAEFANGQYLVGSIPSGSLRMIRATALVPAATGELQHIAVTGPIETNDFGDGIAVDLSGNFAGTNVADGETHDLAIRYDGANTAWWYVDGVEVATDGATPTPTITSLIVGESLVGVISHVAIYTSDVSADRVAAHASAALTGHEDDTPGERVERYALYAGIPATEVDADAGSTPIAHLDTTGTEALAAMRRVEEAEGGVLHDGRDGNLRFRSRTSRYGQDPAVTLDAEAQEIEAGYMTKPDRAGIVNVATITTADDQTFRAEDTASRDDYGPQTHQADLLTNNGPTAESTATWLVNTYAEPSGRVPTLGVDLLPFSPERQAAILDADIGTLVSVANLPSQAADTDVDFFVEGYTEDIDPESYTFTFNVSPAALVAVWVIEDPVAGQLDSIYRLAH